MLFFQVFSWFACRRRPSLAHPGPIGPHHTQTEHTCAAVVVRLAVSDRIRRMPPRRSFVLHMLRIDDDEACLGLSIFHMLRTVTLD